MNLSRHQVSLGALSLVLCLALPMGVLGLFAPATTGDQVDNADTILVARVASMQVVADRTNTVLELAVERIVAGAPTRRVVKMTVDGKPAVEVGDLVLAMLELDPTAILGVYHLRKDRYTLQYEVLTPITGMLAQGIGDMPPVPLALVETAIEVRRGLGGDAGHKPLPNDPVAGDGSGDEEGGIPPDANEPNDDIASATQVFVDAPHMLTGMPDVVTGLTLTPGDVDFFSFDGGKLSVLQAETIMPAGVTSVPDTFLGVFDDQANLLAFDDDSGQGKLSRVIVPLEGPGSHFVGVESAPDTDLDFAGDEGTTVGFYDLALELKQASYLSNDVDLILGVSPDGSFIEDLIGFKEIGGQDVLRTGVAADGWGVSYDAITPSGVTSVFGGGGDHLSDPGFTTALSPGSFTIGPFTDSNGFNRMGSATAVNLVPHLLAPRRGVVIRNEYQIGLNQRAVDGSVMVQMVSKARLRDVLYERVMDVDLFGTGPDNFFWKFASDAKVKAFAVGIDEGVGNLTEPVQTESNAVGDMQFALVIEHGDGNASSFNQTVTYPAAFTLVSQFVSEVDAVDSAMQNLNTLGMETWVIAVDRDPDTMLYSAFGAGLADP